MTARHTIVAVVLAISLASSGVARAQSLDPSTLSAQQRDALGDLFTRARTAYESGNFLEAVELLEQAHRIFPEPNIIYRIGDAYESAGDLAAAVDAYRRYLQAAPQAADRGIISRRIEDLERRIAAVQEEEPPPRPTALVLDTMPLGAAIEIDGAATGSFTPARIPVEPGLHEIVLRAEGFVPLKRTFAVEAGETMSLVYELDPVAPPPEGAGPGPWPWIVGGMGIASLAASATLFVVSHRAASRVEAWDAERDAAFEDGLPIPPRPTGYDESVRTRVGARRGALVALGVGAAALGTGIVWFTLAF